MLYKLIPLLISFNIFAGPACNWKPIKTDTTKSNNYSFQVVTLDCNIDYYKDENITAQEAVIRDSNNKIIVDHIGSWNWDDGSLNYADEVSMVDTPAGFPYQVILTSVYGGSNISHIYHIYSTTPTLKKIGEVSRPVNQYQATNGKGSEREVVGFYKDKGVFLIDRYTTKGMELGRCNACQDWNIETLALGKDNLVSINLRSSFGEYNPFKLNQYFAKGLLFQHQGNRLKAKEYFAKASKEGVSAAQLRLAMMSISDIEDNLTKVEMKEQLLKLKTEFIKVKEESQHPDEVKTAIKFIKLIGNNLSTN